ncbi:MAG: alginate lyase family protein [Candidatus Latescibacteria bacterium]|jgi:heparan-sulfate lyase|nr:alginate lyase family protein [Candidatus Latescibacterota bacterium]
MSARKSSNGGVSLTSLDPTRILDVLDLLSSGLEEARAAAGRGDREGALKALLAHHRARDPLPEPSADTKDQGFERADQIVNHVLQWGPYEEADYGDDIDWEWDPRGDIEWVAAVYRFHWAAPLAQAFRATRDEKYGKAFVELSRDWIAKHRLEDRERIHPVYTHWKGFVWLDIQTGIRATSICEAFRTLVHAEAFTPEFLGTLMASLYDHQVKTEALPMGVVHNKAIFEQRGFINVAYTFPEFRDSRRWMEFALDRACDQLLAQTTTDGVQREWSFGYHTGVLRDAVEIADRMDSVGIAVPDAFRDRIRAMYDYIFGVATPDLGAPMFGDGSRPLRESDDRARWPLYSTLVEASELLGDPKYAARATLERAALPEGTCCGFSEAGIYVLRDDWGTDAIHFALHCSPKAISSHDQPDNGTFELYAYGRWLMPDTGFYTYGHDPDGRAWHRQTRVHQTLTLDGRDSADAGRELLWQSSPELDAVVVENASYEGLIHRRTVWFVERRFFVLLDEAIGDAQGALDLSFQLAPGDATLDSAGKWARTAFGDANVLVWAGADAPVTLEEEEGWLAWAYGYRKPRKAFRFRHRGQAPATFLTLVVPYRGTEAPEVSASLADGFRVGDGRAAVKVEGFGRAWEVGRDLEKGEAWGRAR